jgi:hypothetical protein
VILTDLGFSLVCIVRNGRLRYRSFDNTLLPRPFGSNSPHVAGIGPGDSLTRAAERARVAVAKSLRALGFVGTRHF